MGLGSIPTLSVTRVGRLAEACPPHCEGGPWLLLGSQYVYAGSRCSEGLFGGPTAETVRSRKGAAMMGAVMGKLLSARSSVMRLALLAVACLAGSSASPFVLCQYKSLQVTCNGCDIAGSSAWRQLVTCDWLYIGVDTCSGTSSVTIVCDPQLACNTSTSFFWANCGSDL